LINSWTDIQTVHGIKSMTSPYLKIAVFRIDSALPDKSDTVTSYFDGNYATLLESCKGGMYYLILKCSWQLFVLGDGADNGCNLLLSMYTNYDI